MSRLGITTLNRNNMTLIELSEDQGTFHHRLPYRWFERSPEYTMLVDNSQRCPGILQT